MNLTRLWRYALPLVLVLTVSTVRAQQPAGTAPGGGVSSVQPKVTYAKHVEGIFDLTYATVPGFRPLKLDVYRQTTATQDRPLVVFLHGGGWMVGSPRMVSPVFGEQDRVLAELAAHGYVVAGVSYRLSGEARFPGAIEDVKGAIRWLRANASKFGIDPKRVAVWGESAGAYLAVLAGTSCRDPALEGKEGNPDQSSCVQAVVDFYAPVVFTQLQAQSAPDSRIRHDAPDSPESRLLGCTLPQCPDEQLKQANPLSYLKSNAPPFLIMHGTADTAVPIAQSRMLRDALQAQGVKATLIEIKDTNHGFVGASKSQAEDVDNRLIEFLDATLGVKGH